MIVIPLPLILCSIYLRDITAENFPRIYMKKIT